MRISTLHIYNLANNSMANANSEIVKTQEQLSTGKRVITAADDPVAATQIQQLTDHLAVVDQYTKNISTAENNLSLEETTLKSVTNLVQRMKELAVQAGNTASLSESEYNALATEVDSRLDELIGLTNAQNANGDYIFSGYKSDSPAFVGDKVNGYAYAGDEGSLRIKIDNNNFVQSSDSGKKIFVDIPSAENTVSTSVNPNNRSSPAITVSIGEVVDQDAYDDFYPEDMVVTFNDDSNLTPAARNFTVTERSTGKIIADNQPYSAGEPLVFNGVSVTITGNPSPADTGGGLQGDQLFINSSSTQDVMTTLLRFRDAMQSFDGTQTSRESISTIVANTLDNLSHVEDSVSQTVTEIGARVNILESIKDQHADTELVSNSILSDIRDLDYAEAASRLSAQTLILQAAQASFLRISELNLFSRL